MPGGADRDRPLCRSGTPRGDSVTVAKTPLTWFCECPEPCPLQGCDCPNRTWTLVLFIPGRPAPQGSKRHVGGGVMVESSKALGPWRTVVAWHAAQAYTGALMDGPVRVRLSFVMPRPVSTPKRSTPPAIKKPDCDKLARAILDSLTSVVWRDDSQVVDMHVMKRIAALDEQPGCHIRVETI